MKKLSVLALILALVISVTGCSGGELKLYNAFNKMQDVTSIKTDTTLGFTLETEGFSEEEQLDLQQLVTTVNNTQIEMKQKMVQNKDKTVSKAEVDTKLDLGGMSMDMKVWVDMDMSTDKVKMVEIIKMPKLLMGSMFPNDPAKEYIIYDIGEMVNTENEEMNFNEIMKFSQDFQPKFTEFMKEIQKDFKPGFKIVKQKDDRVVGNNKLEIYELKLDDATLKELVRYAVNYSLDNEATIQFIEEYVNLVMDIAATTETEEIQQDLEEFEKKLPEFKEKFNEFMDEYKDIKILGEKGIVIEYGINEKGYIVHEEGYIDLALDLGKISKAIDKEALGIKGVIKLGINYTSRNHNINNKVLGVVLPKINKSNSVNYMELLQMQMEQMQQLQQAPAPEPAPAK